MQAHLNKFKTMSEVIDGYMHKRESLQHTISDLNFKINLLYEQYKTVQKAQLIVQEVAQKTQEQLKYYITNPINTALKAVFEDPPNFIANIVQRRGKTEVDLLYETNGWTTKPINSSGGGLLNVTSFALRISFWNLQNNKAPLFVMDEPSHFLSAGYQADFGKMVKMITDKLGVQVIMVTHQTPVADQSDLCYTLE